MGITNQEFLDDAAAAFRGVFDEIFVGGVAPGAWSLYTVVQPTNSLDNTINVLETMPVMREWIGNKVFHDIRASRLKARIKKYEKSMKIDRLDFEQDRRAGGGAIGQRMKLFLNSDGGAVYDLLAFARLIANPTCYDGVALFSASHPRGPGGANQSNITASALSFSVHDSILTAASSFRDENSEPMRISLDTLIVGPSNRAKAMEITQSKERIAGIAADGSIDSGTRVAAAAIANVYAGGDMTLVVDNRLVGTNAAKCVYLDTKRGPKPIIMYEFRKPEPQTQFKMDDDGRFSFDELRASVECDVVAAPGAWQTAYLINA